MSAAAFHAIATQFSARYLHPLQFRRDNTIEDRVGALENSRRGQDTPAAQQRLHTEPKPGTDEHFDRVMARSAEALKRTSYAAGNAEEAAHAQRMKRSGDILQNIRNTAAEHRAAAPLPEEKHADTMARTSDTLDRIRSTAASHNEAFHAQAKATASPVQSAPQTPPPAAKPQRIVQAGLFGPSQVRAPQQFGLAATQGPRPQGKQIMTSPRGPRVTQPGLFPKSAVKRVKK
jgi:truncated hemoglobin YjbI